MQLDHLGQVLFSEVITQGDSSANFTVKADGKLLLGTETEGQGEADDLTIATSAHTGMTIRSGTTSKGAVYFSDGTSGDSEYRGVLEYNHSDDHESEYSLQHQKDFV